MTRRLARAGDRAAERDRLRADRRAVTHSTRTRSPRGSTGRKRATSTSTATSPERSCDASLSAAGSGRPSGRRQGRRSQLSGRADGLGDAGRRPRRPSPVPPSRRCRRRRGRPGIRTSRWSRARCDLTALAWETGTARLAMFRACGRAERVAVPAKRGARRLRRPRSATWSGSSRQGWRPGAGAGPVVVSTAVSLPSPVEGVRSVGVSMHTEDRAQEGPAPGAAGHAGSRDRGRRRRSPPPPRAPRHRDLRGGGHRVRAGGDACVHARAGDQHHRSPVRHAAPAGVGVGDLGPSAA